MITSVSGHQRLCGSVCIPDGRPIVREWESPVKRKGGGKNSSRDVSRRDDASDADVFERAMADVVRLVPDPRGRIREAPSVSPPSAAATDDSVAEPDGDFAAHGAGRRELKKLKRGEYPVGDWRDLHGMTAAEACASVDRLIDNSRHARHRCVCIVHGRGLHSEGQTSVLKARVRERLRQHRSVLAYADAPPSDGGSGAVHVLLRK